MTQGTIDHSRPYAAPSNVIGVLARARSRNLPDVISNDFLRLSDVPEAAYGRVILALRFLGLITGDNRPTDILRAISGATDAHYRDILARAIRSAYQSDFERIDPAKHSQSELIDAFRPYQPRSQTPRMVMFFLGLCREAGMDVLDAPRDRKMRTAAAPGRPHQPTPAYQAAAAPGRVSMSAPIPDATVPDNGGADGAPNGMGRGPAGSAASGTPRISAFGASDGLIFRITEADLAALDDTEFNAVWGALGTILRARIRRVT